MTITLIIQSLALVFIDVDVFVTTSITLDD